MENKRETDFMVLQMKIYMIRSRSTGRLSNGDNRRPGWMQQGLVGRVYKKRGHAENHLLLVGALVRKYRRNGEGRNLRYASVLLDYLMDSEVAEYHLLLGVGLNVLEVLGADRELCDYLIYVRDEDEQG